MTQHVILGNGQVGATTARMLADTGETVRVLSRSGGDNTDHITYVTVDAGDRDALLAATEGADIIYNCANPSRYDQWARQWPPMAAALLDAAETNNAGLVVVGNLYVYSEQDRHMTERSPMTATTTKGRIRAEMWNEAIQRHRAGRIRVTEARASDYFGPGALSNAMLGDRIFRPLMTGRGVSLLGDPDAKHSFTYIPDVAAALVRLGTDDRSWGRAWHVPTAPPRSQREMIEAICTTLDRPMADIRRTPWWPVTHLAGAFNPHLRGFKETRHQWDTSYIMESNDFTDTFGDKPTDTDQAIAETINWWRNRVAAA